MLSTLLGGYTLGHSALGERGTALSREGARPAAPADIAAQHPEIVPDPNVPILMTHGELATSYPSVYQSLLADAEKALQGTGLSEAEARRAAISGTMDRELLDRLNRVTGADLDTHSALYGNGTYNDPVYGWGTNSNYTLHMTGDPSTAFQIARALGLVTDQAEMLAIRMPRPGETLVPGEIPTVNVVFPLPEGVTPEQYAGVAQDLATDPRLVDRNGEPLFSGSTQLFHPDGRQEFYANSYYNQLTPQEYREDVIAKRREIDDVLSDHNVSGFSLRDAATQVYKRSQDHPTDFLAQVSGNDRGRETGSHTGDTGEGQTARTDNGGSQRNSEVGGNSVRESDLGRALVQEAGQHIANRLREARDDPQAFLNRGKENGGGTPPAAPSNTPPPAPPFPSGVMVPQPLPPAEPIPAQLQGQSAVWTKIGLVQQINHLIREADLTSQLQNEQAWIFRRSQGDPGAPKDSPRAAYLRSQLGNQRPLPEINAQIADLQQKLRTGQFQEALGKQIQARMAAQGEQSSFGKEMPAEVANLPEGLEAHKRNGNRSGVQTGAATIASERQASEGGPTNGTETDYSIGSREGAGKNDEPLTFQQKHGGIGQDATGRPRNLTRDPSDSTDDTGYLLPRSTLAGTAAEGVLDPDVYQTYRDVLEGREEPGVSVYHGGDVFVGDAQARLHRALSPPVFESPVWFSHVLDDNTLGTIANWPSSPTGLAVLMNGRVKMDPEQLAHTVAEEMIHIERAIRGREFDMEPPYKERIHEISARKGTDYVTQFPRPLRYTLIKWEHPFEPTGNAGKLALPQSRTEAVLPSEPDVIHPQERTMEGTGWTKRALVQQINHLIREADLTSQLQEEQAWIFRRSQGDPSAPKDSPKAAYLRSQLGNPRSLPEIAAQVEDLQQKLRTGQFQEALGKQIQARSAVQSQPSSFGKERSAEATNLPGGLEAKYRIASAKPPSEIGASYGTETEHPTGIRTRAGTEGEKSIATQEQRGAGQGRASWQPKSLTGDNIDDTGYQPPRSTLAGTAAEGVLDPDVFQTYRDVLEGREEPGMSMYNAGDAFVGEAQARLHRSVSEAALRTPITFSYYPPDDTLGAPADFPPSPSGKAIMLNARLEMDPEQLAHTIAEEIYHVERGLREREFDETGPYLEREHEKSARRGSDFVTGFPRPKRYAGVVREHTDASTGNVGKYTIPQSRAEAILPAQSDATPIPTERIVSPAAWTKTGLVQQIQDLIREADLTTQLQNEQARIFRRSQGDPAAPKDSPRAAYLRSQLGIQWPLPEISAQVADLQQKLWTGQFREAQGQPATDQATLDTHYGTQGSQLAAAEAQATPETLSGAIASTPESTVSNGFHSTKVAQRLKASPTVVRSVQELIAAAHEQSSWRDWYDRYQDTLRQHFGEDTDLFKQLLSATSQAASVPSNVALAIKAYGQFLAGEPFSGFLPAVMKNLERVRNEQALAGQKIGQFGQANAGESGGVAVDRHVSEMFFGEGQVRPTAEMTAIAQQHIQAIADELGWKPREVQAALWASNIVRKGGVPQSYDTFIQRKAANIADLRSQYARGAEGSVSTSGDIAPKNGGEATTGQGQTGLSDNAGGGTVGNIRERLDTAIAETQARIDAARTQGGEKLPSGLDPTGGRWDHVDFQDIVRLGALHIARGAITLADFTKAMVENLGEAILPHIVDLYHTALDHYHNAIAPAFHLPHVEATEAPTRNLQETTAAVPPFTGARNAMMEAEQTQRGQVQAGATWTKIGLVQQINHLIREADLTSQLQNEQARIFRRSQGDPGAPTDSPRAAYLRGQLGNPRSLPEIAAQIADLQQKLWTGQFQEALGQQIQARSAVQGQRSLFGKEMPAEAANLPEWLEANKRNGNRIGVQAGADTIASARQPSEVGAIYGTQTEYTTGSRTRAGTAGEKSAVAQEQRSVGQGSTSWQPQSLTGDNTDDAGYQPPRSTLAGTASPGQKRYTSEEVGGSVSRRGYFDSHSANVALFDSQGNRQLPRGSAKGTRAEGLLSEDFMARHRQTAQADSLPDITVDQGMLREALEPETVQKAKAYMSDAALDTPLLFTDHLSDRTAAAHVETSNPQIPRAILINSRFVMDPDLLLFTLLEEGIHAQQVLDGADVNANRAKYAYREDPLEVEAKEKASKLAGYSEADAQEREPLQTRKPPSGLLFDHLIRTAEHQFPSHFLAQVESANQPTIELAPIERSLDNTALGSMISRRLRMDEDPHPAPPARPTPTQPQGQATVWTKTGLVQQIADLSREADLTTQLQNEQARIFRRSQGDPSAPKDSPKAAYLRSRLGNPRSLPEIAAQIADLQQKLRTGQFREAQGWSATHREAIEQPAPTTLPTGGEQATPTFRQWLDDAAEQAYQRIQSDLGQLNAGFDPRRIGDVATIALNHISKVRTGR
ncbi:MAG TPA: hypothetical protein VKU00_26345 [Chthonomonadaceae bacterium]|nr:hypothetical protein [Chthonomonadaceae bacterium]